jgi:hypothetical protein
MQSPVPSIGLQSALVALRDELFPPAKQELARAATPFGAFDPAILRESRRRLFHPGVWFDGRNRLHLMALKADFLFSALVVARRLYAIEQALHTDDNARQQLQRYSAELREAHNDLEAVRCGMARLQATRAPMQTLREGVRVELEVPVGEWSNAFVPGEPISTTVADTARTPLVFALPANVAALRVQPGTGGAFGDTLPRHTITGAVAPASFTVATTHAGGGGSDSKKTRAGAGARKPNVKKPAVARKAPFASAKPVLPAPPAALPAVPPVAPLAAVAPPAVPPVPPAALPAVPPVALRIVPPVAPPAVPLSLGGRGRGVRGGRGRSLPMRFQGGGRGGLAIAQRSWTLRAATEKAATEKAAAEKVAADKAAEEMAMAEEKVVAAKAAAERAATDEKAAAVKKAMVEQLRSELLARAAALRVAKTDASEIAAEVHSLQELATRLWAMASTVESANVVREVSRSIGDARDRISDDGKDGAAVDAVGWAFIYPEQWKTEDEKKADAERAARKTKAAAEKAAAEKAAAEKTAAEKAAKGRGHRALVALLASNKELGPELTRYIRDPNTDKDSAKRLVAKSRVAPKTHSRGPIRKSLQGASKNIPANASVTTELEEFLDDTKSDATTHEATEPFKSSLRAPPDARATTKVNRADVLAALESSLPCTNPLRYSLLLAAALGSSGAERALTASIAYLQRQLQQQLQQQQQQ